MMDLGRAEKYWSGFFLESSKKNQNEMGEKDGFLLVKREFTGVENFSAKYIKIPIDSSRVCYKLSVSSEISEVSLRDFSLSEIFHELVSVGIRVIPIKWQDKDRSSPRRQGTNTEMIFGNITGLCTQTCVESRKLTVSK